MKKMVMLVAFGLLALNVNAQEIKTYSIIRSNDSIKKTEFAKLEKEKADKEALKAKEKARKEAIKERKKIEKERAKLTNARNQVAD